MRNKQDFEINQDIEDDDEEFAGPRLDLFQKESDYDDKDANSRLNIEQQEYDYEDRYRKDNGLLSKVSNVADTDEI